MTTEHTSEKIERKSEKTSEELLNLKKELAGEVADKLQEKEFDLLSYIENPLNIFKKHILKEWISDYLVDEKTLADKAHDGLLGNIGEGIITANIERYREMFREATTEDDLERLRADIFYDIENNREGGSNTQSPKTTTNRYSTNTASNEKYEENTSNTSFNTQHQETSTNTPSKNRYQNPQKEETEEQRTTQKAKVNNTNKSYEIDHFNITISPEIKKRRDSLKGKEKPALEAFACSMKAYESEKNKGHLKNTKYLTVVDFTKNQLKDNRFFVINLEKNKVEEAQKCGHGKNSGGLEYATSFSNKKGSHKSSLGAFITPDSSRFNSKGTWKGSFPKGMESSNNATRGIAIHPVKSFNYKSGELTSEGCFTLTCGQNKVNKILDKINGGSLVFAYAKSKDYFAQSNYFKQNSDGSIAA